MKPIYKSLALAATTLKVSLSLQAQVNDGESVTESAVSASILDGLKVELVSPNVTGARDLIASGECVIDGADLNILLNAGDWIEGATYSVRVSAVFGTQTVVLYVINVSVPRYDALASETQEYEDTITVVSTFGDGDKSGADASVYSKDGDGNAKITKPLSIGDGVVSNDGAVASGYANGENSYINASGAGAVASGYINGDGSYIEANSDGSVASGYTSGENSYIKANGDGAVASGRTEGENSHIEANSAGAVVSGYTGGDGSYINANGDGAVASGYANGENSYISASAAGAVASGYTGGDGSYINASYDGAVASGYTSGENSYISASAAGAVASGYANSTSGNIEASGDGSQAFGIGVQAMRDGQMVCGQCNVVDEDDTFQMIVGNGADDEHRSNAFGVTKSGSLALFKADGTPIYLDAAKLEALIAMLPSA